MWNVIASIIGWGLIIAGVYAYVAIRGGYLFLHYFFEALFK